MAKNKLAFGIEPSDRSYRLRLARYKGLGEAVAEHVRHHANDTGRMKLLDVGMGSGRSMRFIEAEGDDVVSRLDFIGVDLSPRRLDSVYKPGNWTRVQGDVTKGLPFESARFDVVVCEQVLEHLHEPARVLREMGRLLKTGGLLVVGVPTFWPGLSLIRRHVIPRIDRALGKDRGHVQVFTLPEVRKVLHDAGVFDLVEARGFRVLSGGPFSPLENTRWWWRFNRRLGKAVPALCIEIQVLARRKA